MSEHVAFTIIDDACKQVIRNCMAALAGPAPESGLHPLTAINAKNVETLRLATEAADVFLKPVRYAHRPQPRYSVPRGNPWEAR